jgi:hypothetical protein
MRKLLAIMVLGLMMWCGHVNASDWNTKLNESISGEFKSNSKMKLPLDGGEWTLINKEVETTVYSISLENLTFVQMENNIPVKVFEIGRVKNLGKFSSLISGIIQAEIFKPKKGGCKQRQHYNYLNFYKKGAAHNCMMVSIFDVNRELFPSDYDEDVIFSAGIRQWVKKEKINLPKLYLSYSASFHAMTVRNEWWVMFYAETPEKFCGYKPKFTSRDTTRLHPDKISNFPEPKNCIKNWVKKTANMHQNFEDFQAAKKYQRLDLSSISPNKSKKIFKFKSNELTEQLIQLDKLYKSGVLTKDEFNKAKKKLLN